MVKKIILSVAAALAGVVAFAQSTLRVEVPNVVAASEQFNVTFVIEGEGKPSSFSWTPGDDFQLVWGPQTGSSTSIQIINGKSTRSSQYTYSYILMPKKIGRFTLPAATAKFKSGEISSKAVEIEVVSDGSSSKGQIPDGGVPSQTRNQAGISDEDLFMRLELSRSSVVVGEPVTVSLKLYQRVNVAGFEDARFPSFNGFWSQEVEAPTNIEFQRESFDNKIYNTALLRKWVIIPQQDGQIAIDPAELVCLVNVRVSSSGGRSIFDGFFDDYKTIRKRIYSQTAKVKVSPLPAGAPASFSGGVGTFNISASLSKDSLSTHEAASLTVTVRGRGNVSLLSAPKVSFPPDMEVYDAKVSEKIDKGSGGTSGSKTYEFPFIPRSHGDFTIPSIAYSYYDINAGKYVTLTTKELKYNVAKGKEQPGGAGAVSTPLINRGGVKNLGEDIRFISVKPDRLVSKGSFFVLSSLFWVLIAAIALLAAACWFAFRKIAARRADVVGARTRKASKVAVKRLRQAGDFLKKNLYTAFYEELHKALLGYVADKLNIAMTDLSKEKIAEQLVADGIPEDVAGEFTGILDACEFARYSPDAGHEAMERHYNEAVNVISTIESKMKRKNSSAPAKAALAVMLLLALPVAGRAASGNGYIDSLWNKASAAYTDGLWSEAVAGFETISSLGLESAALYCNIGDANFKDGNYPRAILYYERALKLDPSYSDARYNLEIVSHLIQDRIDPVPEFILKTWCRKICYLLDSNTWAVFSIIFFAIMAAMVLLFFLGSSPAARRAGFFTGIAALLLVFVSLEFSLWQRRDYIRADSAIIMRPVTSVKSSPTSESSTDLFILHEGTKVRILDEVGVWRNISLADGRQGWMLSSDMEQI